MRSPINRRFFKLYLLHNDETIKEDITNQVLLDGNLVKEYKQGQTRSLNITLMNPTNIWNPTPISGKLWANTKFKLQLGVEFENAIYWVDEGIFVTQDPDLTNADSNKIVSLQLFDKFALLDGTVDGKTATEYKIPVNSSIFESIKSLLKLERDNMGNVYDMKTIIFPSKYIDKKTPYTLSKNAMSSIGEIIIDLCNMLSCDVFYNEVGHLTIRDGVDDLDPNNRSVVWEYDKNELETLNTSMKIEWSKIRNRYLIIGANVNGMLYKGIAENTNLQSPYNIFSEFGVKTEVITDNLINSPDLCLERARYELKKNAINNVSISFSSIFLPHINSNDLVRWSNQDYGLLNEEFIVKSVSIPLNPKEHIGISVSNIKELPL